MRKPSGSTAAQLLLRPDALFTIATLQHLSPYCFWLFGVGAAVRSSSLNYMPLALSVGGWLAFLFGVSLVWLQSPAQVSFQFAAHETRTKRLIWAGLAFGLVQVYLTARVFGVVPMLSYVQGSGELNAGKAVQLQQDSFVGQIALINLTVVLLGALLLALAVAAMEKQRKVTLTFYAGLFVDILLSLFNAKRIGMVRVFSLLVSGLLLYNRQSLRNLTVLLPFVKSRKAAIFSLLGLLLVQFAVFGPIAELRNPGALKTSSSLQVIGYQEDVILNMEEQTAKVGWGPNRFSLLAPFSAFLPNKLAPEIPLDQVPPKVDPSSPNGFYELLHWYWGPIGCMLFPMATGALCMWLYRKARTGAAYFFCYSYVVTSLLLAHTFNEFFIAPAVVVPWLCFAGLARVIASPKTTNASGRVGLRPLRLRRIVPAAADHPPQSAAAHSA